MRQLDEDKISEVAARMRAVGNDHMGPPPVAQRARVKRKLKQVEKAEEAETI